MGFFRVGLCAVVVAVGMVLEGCTPKVRVPVSAGQLLSNPGPIRNEPPVATQVDFGITITANASAKGNLQSEWVVASPAVPLPAGMQIVDATAYWAVDPGVQSRCSAASGGPLGAQCVGGGGFTAAPMNANAGLAAADRLLEITADARLFGAPGAGGTFFYYVVYRARDAQGSDKIGASELRSLQIQPATAKLFAEVVDDAVRESTFGASAPAPVRDTSLSGDGLGEVWISTTGNDANPGTFSQPVLTLDAAKAIARTRWPNEGDRAGKSIIFRGGTYINGRGPTFRQYNLSFNPETYYNWNGIPGFNFKIRGYWGDNTPVIIDNHAYDISQTYLNPTAIGATDPYAWQDYQLVGRDRVGNYGASIAGSQNLTFEGITIYGAFMEGLDIDDTRNVRVRFVNIHGASKWGMQAFGQNVSNLEIAGCRITGTLLEHGIYIASGAHGLETGGPILIHHNELAYNGRNGIQVNGSNQWVRIENNLVYRNRLAGIASTGNANVMIRDNFVAENLKQGITLLMYVDGDYWNPADPARMLDWRAKHFAAMGSTIIRNNTIVVRPEKFDPASTENPASHGAIDLATWGGGMSPSLGEYPHHAGRDLRIEGNRIHGTNISVIRTQIDAPLEDFRGQKTMSHIRAVSNRIYAASGAALFCTPFSAQWCEGGDRRPIAQMQSQYPLNRGWGWSDNAVLAVFSSMPPVDTFPVGQGLVDTKAWLEAHPFNRAGYVLAP